MIVVKDLVNKLLDVFSENPHRFMRFENKVWSVLMEMPENSYMKLSERCKPETLPLLRDVVTLFIIEQPFDPGASYWEFADDDTVYRSSTCYQSIPRPLPVWDPNTTNNEEK